MKRIRSLEDLSQAARRKRAVFIDWYGPKVLPARFVLNWPGAMLCQLMHYGIYLYPKKK